MAILAPLLIVLHLALCTLAVSVPSRPPTIQLDDATVFGVSDGWTRSFLGIPFAESPAGQMRLQLPKAVPPYSGTINATQFGKQCLNTGASTIPSWLTSDMKTYLGTTFGPPNPSSFDEDCLNLNVIVPENVGPLEKLPIVAYIFFSGFDFSGTYNEDGRIMVNHSVAIGEPVIWVSMNYRLGPYGFLPGKEVKEAGVGNLGLQDQRLALRWIQKYAKAFGGDPSRVTLLGLSAGGSSAIFHTVANGGNNENLFHGVWTESGPIQHAGYIDDPINQAIYDDFVAAVNCSDVADSLQCLRDADISTLQGVAGNSTENFWATAADGVFFRDLPQLELVNGNISQNVAIVMGLSEDEGTLNTLAVLDTTINDTVITGLIKKTYPNITDGDVQKLLTLYPDDPAIGAPYDTGTDFEIIPQWKRYASIAGDIDFDAPIRLTAQLRADKQPVWVYYYERNFVPGFGSTHGAEIPNMYGAGDMTDLLIHFASTFNPNPSFLTNPSSPTCSSTGGAPRDTSKEANTARAPYWPAYSTSAPTYLVFAANDTFAYLNGTYRSEQIDFLNTLNKQP
ncbi:carotenoid ester lipase [Epithele typhae]|uniref:carotenoid ester lipase n=1 Tax=Epithele typhae TaxID=378194 RepID=UPI0020073597|nr:carotenoid ester lipase [Epithele typhae]KAH9926253.1 carotenoid ester lipase [Epithele typhae]